MKHYFLQYIEYEFMCTVLQGILIMFTFSNELTSVYVRTVCTYISTIAPDVSCSVKNAALKNYRRYIFHNENHFTQLYVLTWNTALKTWKYLLVAGCRIVFKKFAKLEISSHSLIYYLTTIASLEPKRSSEQPKFYGTTTNSLVRCGFWGSDECRAFAPRCSCYFL